MVQRNTTNSVIAPTELRGLKCENGMVVRFAHPTINAEAIKSYMDDEVIRQPMVTMRTINYEPTEGLS